MAFLFQCPVMAEVIKMTNSLYFLVCSVLWIILLTAILCSSSHVNGCLLGEKKLCTYWVTLVAQKVYEYILHSVSKETQLFFVDFSLGPGPGSCITPDSMVYTLLQKTGNFQNVAFLLRKSVSFTIILDKLNDNSCK